MADAAPSDPATTASASDLSAQIERAVGLLATDSKQAETLARAVLDRAPEHGAAQLVLAAALRQRGALDEATAILQPMARAETGSWPVQFQWAQLLFAQGQSHMALAPLERATMLNPALSPAWRLLGDIRLVSGQVPAAQKAYDHLLESTLQSPALRDAINALAKGRLAQAEQVLRAILAGDAHAVAAAHGLAEVLGRQGRSADAETLLGQCVERAPNAHLLRQSYALALFRNGKFAAVLTQLEQLLIVQPNDYRSLMIQAAALTAIGDYAAATTVTASVLKAFPDQAKAWLVYGAGLRTLGRLEDSIQAFRTALACDPNCSEAYWSLANLKTYRFGEDELAAMNVQLARPQLAQESRTHLHFTLGKAHEDAARYDQAFEHYAQGNAIQERRRSYDPDRTTTLVARSKALFTPAFFAERAGWGADQADPIFIVGLPRSGSTLVDQILASHPAIEGTRELMDIQLIADWAASLGDYPDPLADLDAQAIAQLGHDYLGWTEAHRKLGRPHFTDKAPWNVLHIGLIHLILPRAKIVDVRRHPMGCGLSAFKQHFAQGFDFSYDLGDIGRYYADYVDLTAHFDAVLPGRIHRVIYEALVADTETQVHRLLAYLGLPFDPACLRFFENRRAVATPSSEQVRQPIFTEAIDQWRRFEPWLGPLKAALGSVLDAYPQAPTRI